MTDFSHTPVLVNEVLQLLITDPRGVYVDGTVGGGGHADAICRQLEHDARLIGFDADADAIRAAAERLRNVRPQVVLVHANVAALQTELARLGVDAITGTLLDLGVSSHQLDDVARGFSFRGDERLDMRMDTRQKRTAWQVVNEYDERRLTEILREYGEERNARRIARTIVERRPIDTTGELARVVESVVHARPVVKTLARVFQAIRIEVNDELRNLEKALADIMDLTAPRGRIVVISYHSLEDRIVKRMFRDASATVVRSAHKYAPDLRVQPRLRVLTRTPITPSDEEIARNPRARSARLRAAERIAAPNGKATS